MTVFAGYGKDDVPIGFGTFQPVYHKYNHCSVLPRPRLHYSYKPVKSRGDLIRMGRIQHHQKQKPTKLYEDFPNILGGHEDSADNGTESGGEEMMVGKLSLKLLVEPKMSPLSYLLVYYVREDGETVPATHVIQVDKCFANKVKASFQNDQGTPGSRASLHITASPHSLCAVAAVDESTNFLAASSALDSEWVFRELAHFHIDPSSGPRQKDVWDYCSKKTQTSPPVEEEEIHRPVVEEEPPVWDLRRRRRRRFVATHPMSKYVDAIQAFDRGGQLRDQGGTNSSYATVFPPPFMSSPTFPRIISGHPESEHPFLIFLQDFGVVVMSDLTLETRPCFSSGQGEVDADRARSSDVRMHVVPARTRSRNMVAMSPLAYPLTVGVPTSPRGYSEDARQPSIEVRTFFPETWLWELIRIGKEGETVLKRDLPHTITDWVGSTVCVSAQHGLGVSSPARVRAFQPFFLDYVMPYSIKRGEVVHLKVSLYNFLAHSLPVRINLEDSPGITLVSDSSTVLACVQEKATLVHKFLIRAAELGEVNVTVTAAVDPEYEEACGPELIIGTRDVLVKSILVKPEGFPVEVTKSSFMCPTEISNDTSMLWSIDLPEDVVKDSARAQISAVADLMGPTLQNLDNLIQLPMGCGEQNMILFVPNLHVINYLNVSQKENPVLKAEAVKNMEKGYQRELNYRHTDGSYSAFGNSDSSGSMWLTAFVVKSFAQARTHIFVDEDDLKMSIRWITKKQLENGCFPLVGQVFHKDMKGGLTSDTSSAALTAYVLISLLETGLPLAPSVASNAVFCLRGDKQPDVYTLALTTYAFSLMGNRTLAEESLRHLMGAATIQQDLIWWEKQDTNSLALNIETTAYGILSLVKLGGERNLIDALRAVRWISKHRNANGGFVSTQDTVVALEALTKYAMAIPSRGTHLSVLVAATDLEHVFHIRQHDRLLLKQRWLPTLPTQVEVVAEGEGCALIQVKREFMGRGLVEIR
uniref:Alpha-2-macroglobulin domain-containing protein n=1 Tax=Timema poppense TaxID=170557 RepID=A0A7R9DFQ3_TIMPO|nr:unnamed protein product [Timema poppensis]